jgi:hypothetical protein
MNSDDVAYLPDKLFRPDAIAFFINAIENLSRGGAPEALLEMVSALQKAFTNPMCEESLYRFGFHRELAREVAENAARCPHGSSIYNLIRLLIRMIREPEEHWYTDGETYLHDRVVSPEGKVKDLLAKNGEKLRLLKSHEIFLQDSRLSSDAITALQSLGSDDGGTKILFHGTTEYYAEVIVRQGIDLAKVDVPNDLDTDRVFYTTPGFRSAVLRSITKTTYVNGMNPDREPQCAAVVVFYCPCDILQGDKAYIFDTASPDWTKLVSFRRRSVFAPQSTLKPIYDSGVSQDDFDKMHVISAPQVCNTADVDDAREPARPEGDDDGSLPKQVAFFTNEVAEELQSRTPLIITFPTK